jgi:hypothetical protein
VNEELLKLIQQQSEIIGTNIENMQLLLKRVEELTERVIVLEEKIVHD